MKTTRFTTVRFITTALAASGIASIAAYIYCEASCTYLKGSIAGLDLTYLGILYMAAVALLCLMGKDRLVPLLLACGIGSEVFLIAYQVKSGVYCPYCLVFAGILVLMFVLNFRQGKGLFMAIASVAGFVFFACFFSGSVTPAYGEENALPSFGSGQVTVRLYTDYFCGPCSSLEGELEEVIVELVRQKKIRLIFIDTPIHRETTVYARYFLYILNEKRDFNHALAARAALFEAAGQKTPPGEIEAFLAKKGIGLREFDVRPVFTVFEKYIREDRVTSTPTCVIIAGAERQTFKGPGNILKALNKYRNKK